MRLPHVRGWASAAEAEGEEKVRERPDSTSVDSPSVEEHVKDREPGHAPPPEPAPATSAYAEFPQPPVYGNPTLGSLPAGLPAPELAVPDTILDGATLGGLTIRGASLRGDGHRHECETRQDSMGIWAFLGAEKTTDALLVCVADGVGGEPYSHVGSAAACELLREEMAPRYARLLNPQLDQDVPALCQALVARLGLKLEDIARGSAREPRSLSTTLVGALLEGDSADPARRRCVVFAVGDSPAFLLRNGTFEPCFPVPHDGVIKSTGTDALPSVSPKVKTAVLAVGTEDLLLLCTDGLSDPMRTPAVSESLAAVWSRGETPSLVEFCWQLSFRAKSYSDDRTAICVWGR